MTRRQGFGLGLGTVALVGATALSWWRPSLFSWMNALATVSVYVLVFILLATTLVRVVPPYAAKIDESRILSNCGEFILFFVLTLLSAVSGMFAGSMWWIAGGHALVTFGHAVKFGAIGGAFVILGLLEGA